MEKYGQERWRGFSFVVTMMPTILRRTNLDPSNAYTPREEEASKHSGAGKKFTLCNGQSRASAAGR